MKKTRSKEGNGQLMFLLPLAYCLLCGCHAQHAANSREPDQIKALQAYKKQPHRFELRDCMFFYNGRQLLFPEPLEEYEKIFGKNHVNDFGDFYFKDMPVLLSTKWANLYERKQEIPGAEKDTARIVTGIQVCLSLPDGIDEPTSISRFRRKFLKQQKMLDGFIMLDSVLFNAQTDVNFINKELFKRFGFEVIKRQFGDYNILGYLYIYPTANGCSPIADENIPTMTSVTIIRENSNNISEVSYGYSIHQPSMTNEESKKVTHRADSMTGGFLHFEEVDSLNKIMIEQRKKKKSMQNKKMPHKKDNK